MGIVRLLVGIVAAFVLWAIYPGPVAYMVFAFVSLAPEFIGGGRVSTQRHRMALSGLEGGMSLEFGLSHSLGRVFRLAAIGIVWLVVAALLVRFRGSAWWTLLPIGLGAASLGAAARSALDVWNVARAHRIFERP